MSHLAIEIGIRFVVFALVFWLAARKLDKVTISPRWATPLVGLAFAALNVALYWLLKPILVVATLGLFGFVVPFVLNGLFLWATARLVAKLRARVEIDGAMALVKMSVILTVTHGLLWVALESFR